MSTHLPPVLGKGSYRSVHKNLEVRPSKIAGRGLHVINERIPIGSVVWMKQEDFPSYTWKQVESFQEEEREIFLNFCWQSDLDSYQGPRSMQEAEGDSSHFWNHSCDPNCWIFNDEMWIARKDIEIDEELTVDYSTYEQEFTLRTKGFESFECRCGAHDCRKNIRATDYMIDSFREKYFPHFQSHILLKIDEYLSNK